MKCWKASADAHVTAPFLSGLLLIKLTPRAEELQSDLVAEVNRMINGDWPDPADGSAAAAPDNCRRGPTSHAVPPICYPPPHTHPTHTHPTLTGVLDRRGSGCAVIELVCWCCVLCLS